MLTPLRTAFAALLLASTTQAAVCIGKNCELLDSISSSKGMPLQTILDNIQRNIVDPIVNSQSMMASWQGGILDYSPEGSSGGIKVTVWGGTSLDTIHVSGNFFGASYSAGYRTGITRTGVGLEIPLTETSDLILNGTFWKGPSDYGTGYMEGTSEETNIRIGAGLRKSVFWNDWSSFYFSSGLLVGKRDFTATFSGVDVRIKTPYGLVGWQGEETYDETVSFISLPASLGGRLKIWDITILGETGARIIGQRGNAKVQKWGAVGPFFGQNGFYNIGLFDQRNTDVIGVWPTARIGLELKTEYDLSIMGNWQPKLGEQPQYFSAGIGVQFLKSSGLPESRRVEKYKFVLDKNSPKVDVLRIS